MSSDSPFQKYRHILLHETYSAAGALQNFALSCYNGSLGQFQGSAIRNFDSHHFGIFLELANYFYQHGENDQHLLEVGAAIWKSRREQGRKLLNELVKHRTIKPSEYEEGGEGEHREQMQWLERQIEDAKAKGWIDSSN